jgi:hypothetical protein
MDCGGYSWVHWQKDKRVRMVGSTGNVAKYSDGHGICFMGIYCWFHLALSLTILKRMKTLLVNRQMNGEIGRLKKTYV